MAKLKSFEFFLNKLLKGFRSVEKREPNNLEMILIKQEAGNKARDAAKVIEVDFGKPFKQEMEDIKGRMSGIKSLSDELEKMSKGYDEYYGTGTSQKYKEKEILEKINKNNKEAIRAFKSKNPEKELMEDVDFPFDGPDDPKKYYTGGMVDVEPSLSDIGHGSDSLMARTRLISPNNQATTSTGLNYLLAEDNDNIRVPFAKGKGVDLLRRGFLKTIGTAGAGLAALKSGILGFGKEAAPVVEKAVETVSETAQNVPPYFLNLVNKIKNLGSKFDGPKERAESYRYKDYEMDIDLDTGAIDIKKTREAMIPGYDEAGVAEEVYMTYKPGMIDETTKGKKTIDEYEEFPARPDMDGKMKDVEGGVPDEVIEEGTMFEDNIKDFGKAEGGLTTMLGE